jgi:hypothetical protein
MRLDAEKFRGFNNAMPTTEGQQASDAALASSLAKLWPHRLHESGAIRNLFCRVGLHRWAQLNLQGLVSDGKQIRFCRWCSKIKIDGVIYDP